MIWEQFGLKENPYDILPLLEGGDLPITKAFVGREKERRYINNLLISDNRACFTICGDVGVGKTSIANVQKFIWKYEMKEKPLFSFRREIEATEEILDKKTFIIEIIGSVLREIELVDPKLLKKHNLLIKLNQMVDVTQTLGLSGSLSAGMFGVSLQSTIEEKQMIQPLRLTMTSLEKQFSELLTFIITHKVAGVQHKGLIIHINNFEFIMKTNKKKVLQFFAEIRDFLQTPNLYFMFLGPNNFFQEVIVKDTRIRSVFNQTPVMLAPLSKEELVEAINKRLALLKSPTAKQIIKPFEDRVIFELYDMFSGDIRMVLSSLKDIVLYLSDKLPKTLTIDEAMLLLGKERLSHIEQQLTDEQLKVLEFIISHDNDVTQNEIAKALQKPPTNISNYYFRPLIELNIIEVKRESGRYKYWGVTKSYLPLKGIMQAKKNIERQIFSRTNLTKK